MTPYACMLVQCVIYKPFTLEPAALVFGASKSHTVIALPEDKQVLL